MRLHVLMYLLFMKVKSFTNEAEKGIHVLNDGRSPGFGLTLVAETVNGFFLSAEMSSTPQGQGDSILPEDLGRKCATMLLEEIYRVRPAFFPSRVCADTQVRSFCLPRSRVAALERAGRIGIPGEYLGYADKRRVRI